MKNKITTFLFLLTFMAMTAVSFAQDTARPKIIPANSGGLAIPSTSYTDQNTAIFGKMLPNLTTTIIALTGALAVAFIIYGGIQILTAYGKTDKLEAAKKTITWAIVGLLISILSYAIVSIIGSIKLT